MQDSNSDDNLYSMYTSTSALLGENERALTAWTAGYFMKYILRHLPVNRDALVLDLGCGYGRYVRACSEAGYSRVIGIDISAQQVRYARETLGLANVVQADAFGYLTDHQGEYDAVLLLDVLEHLELEPSLALLRMVRTAMREGGVLVVQTPNALAPLSPHRYQDVTHHRAYSTRSMSQSLAMTGFGEQDVAHYETPAWAYNWKGALRGLLWRALLRPVIKTFAIAAYGDALGNVYSVNLLTVARKRTKS
ncbi:MAG: class I SAM-dependent methyltransferase [Chloroflexota bacterium]